MFFFPLFSPMNDSLGEGAENIVAFRVSGPHLDLVDSMPDDAVFDVVREKGDEEAISGSVFNSDDQICMLPIEHPRRGEAFKLYGVLAAVCPARSPLPFGTPDTFGGAFDFRL